MTKEYYIGIMSGTSINGIDVGLYNFSKRHPQTLDFYYQPYPLEIKRAIQKLCTPQHPVLLSTYGELDTQLGQLYAEACLHLLDQVNIKAKAVKAIGNHGQTLCHSPQTETPKQNKCLVFQLYSYVHIQLRKNTFFFFARVCMYNKRRECVRSIRRDSDMVRRIQYTGKITV